jgi:ATP-dependent Clp protease ATP-binding subunit ClpC
MKKCNKPPPTDLMFENFTDKAVKAIMLAQEEAQRMGQNLVGTEHLLLGLLAQGNSLGARVLEDMGLNLTATRQTIQQLRGKGAGFGPTNLPFTPTVKQILEKAFQTARRDNSYVTPEYILMVLLSDPNTVAVKVLLHQGIDIKELRTTLVKKMGEEEAVPVTSGQKYPLFESFSQQKPTLEEFGINLTQKARDGHLDPVVGRTREIERVVQILGRRTKSNPVLVGEPGVGKTAIAEGLAQRIIEGEIPEILQDKQVMTLDMGLLVAGTRLRGEFEERLKSIVKQVKEAGNIILVIDEIHTLVGAGSMGGAMDASNILKPALARGELQCLGTTTLDEYRQYIEKDAALERRFQRVMVGEPSVEETIEILGGVTQGI